MADEQAAADDGRIRDAKTFLIGCGVALVVCGHGCSFWCGWFARGLRGHLPW